MKRLLIMILILVAMSSPAYADHSDWLSWDKTNTRLHVPLSLLMLADMRQTLEIAKNPDKYYEKNAAWYMGDHPSENKVYEYFAISYIITTGITYVLPADLSYAFQTIAILERTYVVVGNHSIGIRIEIKI